MRVLLDENLDWRLRNGLAPHEVRSVRSQGWSGLKNGALLTKAVEEKFDALITMDSNFVHQQNLSKHAIAVIALRAKSNQIEDTLPLMPAVLRILVRPPTGIMTVVER